MVGAETIHPHAERRDDHAGRSGKQSVTLVISAQSSPGAAEAASEISGNRKEHGCKKPVRAPEKSHRKQT
jgi:hypothetical protein